MLVNTHLFSEAANYKLKHGVYCKAPYGSKDYRDFWGQEDERCLNGYSVAGLKITGQHYFFLNYKQLEVVLDPHAVASSKERTFPRFWEAHYQFFHALEAAEKAGKHMCILKPRGTGFSEIMSSVGVRNYSLIKGSKNFYFASNVGFLNKDGVITKCWDHLEFLNAQTEKAYRHLRQVKNQDLHKRASMLDPKTGNEYGFKSEIIARIIDHPRKVRGARTGSQGKVFFEEGGSFPNLKEAVTTTRPLVEQGGIATGQIVVWGCVCAGTKVWTKSGILVNIEDLTQEQGIIGYHDTGIASAEDISYMQEPKNKPCYRITTHTGRILECSEDHPILWSNAKYGENKRVELSNVNGKRKRTSHWVKKFKFQEAENIQIGDQVAILDNLPLFGNRNMWDPRTVGWLIGDGSYGFDKTPVLSSCDIEINSYIEKNYSTKLERSYTTTTGKIYKETRIKEICPALRELGIYGQTKLAKTLPYKIDQYTKKDICDLLGGIFDTDGCVHYTGTTQYIDLTSASEALLNEIRFLLQKLGIHCNIKEIECKREDNSLDKNNWFVLYISDGRSIQKFAQEIKFQVKYKQDRLEIISNYKQGRKQKISQAASDKGIRFEIVKTVEFIGDKPVYNLTASGTHTYVANGIITHNTGGEKGPGIEGLEHMFYHPDAYNMMSWENKWDEGRVGTSCSYFIPVYMAMDKFMDDNGNALVEAAKKFHITERNKIHKEDPGTEDKYIAEYPFSPAEALIRLSDNLFPVAELQKQLLRVQTDRSIQGFLKHGNLERDPLTGKPKFVLNTKARPIVEFPHKDGDNLKGCLSIVESPYRDPHGQVPSNLYLIIVDPYYKDDSESKISLAAAYVYKHYNNISPTEDDILVAEYVSRPEKLEDFYKQLFLLAEYYNATIQSEIAGGGKGILDYASYNKLKHYCEKEPDMFYNKEGQMKSYNKPYFMNMAGDRPQLALAYASDWLRQERSAINEAGEHITVLNLHKIYFQGLLQELIKFNLDGNFDRVSALRLLPFMIKDRATTEYRIRQERSAKSFWDREFHTDHGFDNSAILSPWELAPGEQANDSEEAKAKSEAFDKALASYNNNAVYPEDLD